MDKADVCIPIALTQGKIALITPEDLPKVGGYLWHAIKPNKTWYATRHGSHYMHTFLTGFAMTDHVNGNGLDNRRSNLRVTNYSKNGANQRRSLPKSGHRGVTLCGTRWQARLSTRTYLGRYDTKEEAIEAYHKGALERYGAIPPSCGCEE